MKARRWRERGFPYPPRLESVPSEVGKEWLADHWSDCQEGLLLVGVSGPGWDQGWAQVGHLGWLGENLPSRVVEGCHRPGKAVNLRGFELAG